LAHRILAFIELENGYRCYWQLRNALDEPPGEQDVLSVPRDVPRVVFREQFDHYLFYLVEKLRGAWGETPPELIDIQELDIGPVEAKQRCFELLRERIDATEVRRSWVRRQGTDEWQVL